MSNELLDSDSMRTAAVALGEYINELAANEKKMKDAAVDCQDNMGSDQYSKLATARLNETVVGLDKAIREAEDLQKKILDWLKRVEDSGSTL
jgi:hypothetical protein